MTPATVQDCDGGGVLLSTLFQPVPFLEKLYADSAYQGPVFQAAVASILPNIETRIFKRADTAKNSVVAPKRWTVERLIAWLNRRGLVAKDWENLNLSALVFLRLASIRLMLRKPCNST